MEVEQAVRRLRVVRKFRPDPVRADDVRAIIEAGRRAGSSKNLQRWRFILIRDRARLHELAAVGPFARHVADAALAIALVTPDPSAADAPMSVTWDLGRAAQNMILVGWARGVGSAPATVYDHDLCRSLLSYPRDQHCEYLLSFGYPAEADVFDRALRVGGRQPFDELVFHERWGETDGGRESIR